MANKPTFPLPPAKVQAYADTNGIPPPDRVRFTIAVDADVYEAFVDLAASSGVSLSRCIGDWLRDTAEAAQITTLKLNAVRRSPQDAFEAFMRDAVVPATMELMNRPEGLRRRPARGDSPASQVGSLPSAAEPHRPAQGRAAAGGSPPPSNTGGKVGGKTLRTRP